MENKVSTSTILFISNIGGICLNGIQQRYNYPYQNYISLESNLLLLIFIKLIFPKNLSDLHYPFKKKDFLGI